MAVTFNNVNFAAGQASTGAYLLGNFTGTNLLSGAVPVTINGTIDQPNSTVQVNLNVAGVTTTGATGTYVGYSAVPNSQDYVYYFNVTAASLVTPVTVAVTSATALPTLNSQPVITTTTTAPTSATPFCFARGTRIRTTDGDVAIEHLSVGDVVITARGEEKPVRWIGHTTIDCTAQLSPYQVMPVRIRAGAFGTNLPERDLLLSPAHRLYVEGSLVHADFLVNGWSIVRDIVDEVEYWHVEVDGHDVVLAEGLPAETFLDAGNRHGLEDNGTVKLFPPSLDGHDEAEGLYAPVLEEGPELAAIKQALMHRAKAFGARYTNDPGLALIVDGEQVTPRSVDDYHYRYELPEGAESVRLVSRASIPAEVNAASDDRRKLGVMVGKLVVDGHTVSLEEPTFGSAWHLPERADGSVWRWTKGDVSLPVGRTIEFTARPMTAYGIAMPDRFSGAEGRTVHRLRAVA